MGSCCFLVWVVDFLSETACLPIVDLFLPLEDEPFPGHRSNAGLPLTLTFEISVEKDCCQAALEKAAKKKGPLFWQFILFTFALLVRSGNG